MAATRVLSVIECPDLEEIEAAKGIRSIQIIAIGDDGRETKNLFPERIYHPDWNDEVIVLGNYGGEAGKLYFRTSSSSILEVTPYW